MAQKVLGVYVGQSLWLLSYSTEIPTLSPSSKNFGGQNFSSFFFHFWLHKIWTSGS